MGNGSGDAFDLAHNNPVDPTRTLTRGYSGGTFPANTDTDIVDAVNYQTMRNLLEAAHNSAHGLIGGTLANAHISFRDPIVFLVHSNVDRLFARWQTHPAHTNMLDPNLVYGSESADMNINVEPWSSGHGELHDIYIRPWSAPHCH
jgi:hypothetical protein